MVDQLFIAMELFGRVHTFAQGMGIAAPRSVSTALRRPSSPPSPALQRSSCSTPHHRRLFGDRRTVRRLPQLLRRPRPRSSPPDDRRRDHHSRRGHGHHGLRARAGPSHPPRDRPPRRHTLPRPAYASTGNGFSAPIAGRRESAAARPRPPVPRGALVTSGGALHVADQPHQQGVQVSGGREDSVDRLGGVQPLLAAEGTGGDQRTVAQQVRTCLRC